MKVFFGVPFIDNSFIEEGFFGHLLNELFFNHKHHSGFFEIGIFLALHGGQACFGGFVYISARFTAAYLVDIFIISIERHGEIVVFEDDANQLLNRGVLVILVLSQTGLFDTEHRVRLVIDKDLMQEEYIGCHPGISTSSLKLKRDDILRYAAAVDHEPILIDLPDPRTMEA